MPAGSGIGPAPRRHHHGRQWPLGGEARPAARRRPSRRRRSGPQDASSRRRRTASKSLRSMPFRRRTGGGPEEEVSRPQGPARLLSRARAGRARQGGRPAPADRRLPRLRPASWSSASNAPSSGPAGQQPADAGRRAQLWVARARSPRPPASWPRKAAAGEARSGSDRRGMRLEPSCRPHGLPELDLLIRTSGEVRLSNFLLWQAAYAELMFIDDAVAGLRRGGVRGGARRVCRPRSGGSAADERARHPHRCRDRR